MADDLTYPLQRTRAMSPAEAAIVYPTKTMFTELDLADKKLANKGDGGYRRRVSRRRVSRRRVSRRRVSRRRGSRRHRR